MDEQVMINGKLVKFPYKPYPSQLHYMEKVIECLDKGQNAILESPTGTGKTLSLLCATLGWIEHQQEKNGAISNGFNNNNEATERIPRVVFASRTHSQIKQAMNELKRSAYGYMKAGVIASRDQLCINRKLNGQTNENKMHMCKALRNNDVSGETCKFFKGSDAREMRDFSADPVLDIEDLGRIGRKTKSCPYFASKDIVSDADIIFMPYNYLFDPQIRRHTKIDLKNTIIIIDEAHNLGKMCEDSASTSISIAKIRIAIRDTEYVLRNCKEEDINCSLDTINEFETSLIALDFELGQIECGLGLKSPAGIIFELLEKVGINESITGVLYEMISFLVKTSMTRMLTDDVRPTGIGLKALMKFLLVVFSSSAKHLRPRVEHCYKVFIEYEAEKETKQRLYGMFNVRDETKKTIHFWCFSPAFGINHLVSQNIRCLILTSGTLAPLRALETEMEIPFEVKLSNSHVIDPTQVLVRVISIGANGIRLNSSYNNRTELDYLESLGETILHLSKVIPDGMLIFFSSYVVMNLCVDYWESEGILVQIHQQKEIFYEPRTKDEFTKTMRGYYKAVDKERGAIFMAVLRGKVSEGLDFADMYGRAVLIVGIPFAPYKMPKVQMKRDYLDENQTTQNGLPSGDEWYVLDAIRAINQAIGRVIRHKNDYGAILLCDERLAQYKNNQHISKWIQKNLNVKDSYEDFDMVTKNLQLFYTKFKKALPVKRTTPPQIDADDFQSDEDSSDDEEIGANDGDNNYEESETSSDCTEPSSDDVEIISIDEDSRESSSAKEDNAEESSDDELVRIHSRKRKRPNYNMSDNDSVSDQPNCT